MKVLLVSNIFPNSVENERGIFTYRIAMGLKDRCHLEVVAPLPWVPPPLRKRNHGKYVHGRVPVLEEINGLAVHHPRYVVIPKVLGFMHPAFMFMPLLRLTKRLDQKERIDIINAHWIFPDGVAAAWVADRLQKPLILTGLGCDLNHYPSFPLRRRLIKKALNKAKIITVKGNSLKRTLLHMKTPEQKVHVIPNGLDLQRFKIMDKNQARNRLSIKGIGPFLLFVGNMDQVKGGRYLIQALKEMSHDLRKIPRLLMVGDGPLQEDLLSKAEHLGIAHRIFFAGKRPHDEIPLWMNAADLFCLPSIREGRPNVLIEALACGTPAVASNVGSIPEIIHVENGLVARVADPKSLSLQLLACLNQRWDRKAIRKTVGRFTWDDCAELYMQVYEQAISVSH